MPSTRQPVHTHRWLRAVTGHHGLSVVGQINGAGHRRGSLTARVLQRETDP